MKKGPQIRRPEDLLCYPYKYLRRYTNPNGRLTFCSVKLLIKTLPENGCLLDLEVLFTVTPNGA